MYYTPSSKAGFGERVAEVTKDSYTWLRDYVTAIKHGRLHPFTTVERKAREATRKDPWGPTGQQLAELAELSCHPEHCHVIFAVLEFRLSRGPDKWRNVYKALLALEYLLVRGSQAAVELGSSRELHTLLQQLTTFEAIGSGGTDCGVNVRVRSAAVLELLQDPQLLQQRRAAAAERLRAIAPAWQQQYGQYTIGGGGNSSSSSSFAGYSRDQLLPPHAAAAADLFAAPGVGRDSYNNGYDSYNGISGGYTLPGSSSSNSVHQQQQQPAFGGSTPAARDSAAAAAAGGVRSGNFGEAKGVSFEENKLRIAELRQLLARPENRHCADCQDSSPAGRPSWASINLGVFICMRCAGTHRGLGAHISKVRSCTLDTWLPEQVVFMASTGNAAANAHFEARLADPVLNPANGGGGLNPGAFRRPGRDSPEMAAFIRLKYVDKRWVQPGSNWPPPIQQQRQQQQHKVPASAAPVQQQQQQVVVRLQVPIKQPPAQQPAAAAAAGFEDSAFPAAPGAVGAAAVTPAPAAAVADLLCLDDSNRSRQSNDHNGNNSRHNVICDIMDAPMDVPGPTMSVVDWIEQRIASGADAAAQVAADAARLQRLRHHQQHHGAAAAAAAAQQQQQQYVFDPFTNGTAGQQQQQEQEQQHQPVVDPVASSRQQGGGISSAVSQHTQSGSGAARAAHTASVLATQQQQQQQQQRHGGGFGGLLHSLSRHTAQRHSAAAGNVISTYEFTLSSDEESEEEEEDGQQPPPPPQQQQQRSLQTFAAAGGTAPSAPTTATAAVATPRAAAWASQHVAQQQPADGQGSSSTTKQQQQQGTLVNVSSNGKSSTVMSKPGSTVPLIPATPGFATFTAPSYNPHAAAGFTGAAAAGFTGSRPHLQQATGQHGGSRAIATAGPTGSSVAAGFTGAGAGRVYYAPVGFGGGWGGYAVVPAVRAGATGGGTRQYQLTATGGGSRGATSGPGTQGSSVAKQ